MNPKIIAWCGWEQMCISWFLRCSCTGEKLRGLNCGFVSCYTSAFQPLSHELVKSWWDVVAGAAFEMLFSHAQDWQKQLMTVSALSHVRVSCPPFPQEPGWLLLASSIPGAACARGCVGCWGITFLLDIVRRLGEGWGHMEISHICGLPAGPLWIEADIAPQAQKKEAVLPSVENSRVIILLFPNKEISQRILV